MPLTFLIGLLRCVAPKLSFSSIISIRQQLTTAKIGWRKAGFFQNQRLKHVNRPQSHAPVEQHAPKNHEKDPPSSLVHQSPDGHLTPPTRWQPSRDIQDDPVDRKFFCLRCPAARLYGASANFLQSFSRLMSGLWRPRHRRGQLCRRLYHCLTTHRLCVCRRLPRLLLWVSHFPWHGWAVK
jgi:hypothetical protein